MQFRFSLLIRGAQQSEKTASLLKSMQGNDSEPETGKQMVESKERRGRREKHIKPILTVGTAVILVAFDGHWTVSTSSCYYFLGSELGIKPSIISQ